VQTIELRDVQEQFLGHFTQMQLSNDMGAVKLTGRYIQSLLGGDSHLNFEPRLPPRALSRRETMREAAR
jgi:hypothetical protein